MGEWSDTKRVEEFLAREIPHRADAERALLAALPGRIERFLDLGTGDGRLLTLVADARPGAVGIGLDSSEPMLERAAERLDGGDGFELRAHDLALPLEEAAPFDAVVSGLAIHHLEDARKRELFGEVQALLAPGGVFANLDVFSSEAIGLHERFLREIGRERDDPSDRIAGLCEQMDWLRDAGFGAVDCHFKWLEMGLVVAVRD